MYRTVVLFLAGISFATCGCVDRRFVVTTNVPGAQIYLDGEPLGPAPVDSHYEYTGLREFRAVAPDYQPLVQKVRFKPRWYDYPGLDLFAEVFWPFRIEDVRYINLNMVPAQPVHVDELNDRAAQVRQRGMTLPAPSIPNDQPGAPKPIKR